MQPTRGTPVGFKTLQEVTGYVSLDDGNILRIIVNIMKVTKTGNRSSDGLPLYSMSTNVNFAVYSQEEYKSMIKKDPTI